MEYKTAILLLLVQVCYCYRFEAPRIKSIHKLTKYAPLTKVIAHPGAVEHTVTHQLNQLDLRHVYPYIIHPTHKARTPHNQHRSRPYSNKKPFKPSIQDDAGTGSIGNGFFAITGVPAYSHQNFYKNHATPFSYQLVQNGPVVSW